MSSTLLFPWIKESSEGRSEAFKWQIGNARYEIHSVVLDDLSLEVLLPHCLDIKNKIEAAVSTANHVGQSYF